MAYTKTALVTDDTTDVLAVQYNSMMAEMKAAALGIMTHAYAVAFTYDGGGDSDLLDTITVTDNSPAGDAGFDVTLVGTITYDGSDLPTSVAWVFDAGEMNITMTETITWAGGVITGVGGVLS